MPKLESLSSSAGRLGGRRGRSARVSSSLAEINVVPLVDVMLVLLVIFMVAAPMMQQGLPVRLPQGKNMQPATAPVTVTVPITFRRDQRVQIDGQWVKLEFLDTRIRQAMEGKAKKDVMLATDGGVTMQETVTVADALKAGGVVNVNLQTQPIGGGSRP